VDFINVYARLNTLTVTKEGKKFFQMPPLVTFGVRGEI